MTAAHGPVPVSVGPRSWQSPVRCPAAVVPLTGPGARSAPLKPYQREELSNAEAAVLTRAAGAADAGLARAAGQLLDVIALVQKTAAEAEGRIDRLAAYTGSGELAEARRSREEVTSRHRDDGADDRRRRAWWLRGWFLWPCVLAAAGYDAWFFASVFRRLLDVSDDPSDYQFWISLVPAIPLALAIVLAGAWLAEPIVRARDRAARRRTRIRPWWSRWRASLHPRSELQDRNGLPWPLWSMALVFLTLVMGVLMLWAALRARETGTGSAAPYPPGAVALLLLLFTATAIAMKIAAHNPFADSAREAAAWTRRAGAERDKRLAAARSSCARAELALHRLDAAVREAALQARQRIQDAWRDILAERHEHGLAGDLAPHFAPAGDPPDDPLFEGLDEPALRWTTLEPAVTALSVAAAAATLRRQQLEELRTAMEKQVISPAAG